MHDQSGDIAKLVRQELWHHVAPATVQDVVLVQSADPQLTIVLRGSAGLDNTVLLALGRRLRAALPPDMRLPQITIRLRSGEPVAHGYGVTVATLVGAVFRASSILPIPNGKGRRRLSPSTPFSNLRSLRRRVLT